MSYRKQRSTGYARSSVRPRKPVMPRIAKSLPMMSPEERAKYPYAICPDCEAAMRAPEPPEMKRRKKGEKQPKVVELRAPKGKGAPGAPKPQEQKKEEKKPREAPPEAKKKKKSGVKPEAEPKGKAEKKPKEKPKKEEKPEKPPLPFDVDKKDIQKAIKGDEEVKREFEKATEHKVDKTTPNFQPVAGTVSASMYRDSRFISKMNSALSDWRSGYVDKIGEKGTRLDIREYIRSKGKQPYITRLKRSAKGRKILVIADFSSSMDNRQEEYKTALINGLEVLDSIGSKIALFGFGAEQRGKQQNMFFKVKKFEEPQWNLTHSSKTASLLATYPSTPLGGVYHSLRRYIKMHRPHVTLTVTDGSPTGDPFSADNEIAELKRSTRMVAFGMGDTAEEAQEMETKLRGLGYHKVFAVSSMRALPEKMVRLLAPE